MEKEEALVSVIMPAYNAEKYIEEAISSVVSQTYENWELLILDDCSSDRTGEKIDMVYLAIIALLGGIACGMTGLDENVIVSWITSNKDMILYLLMFLVGISIGFNQGIVSKIKEYHIKIFVIPLGIVVGSILGGIAESGPDGSDPVPKDGV